MECGTCTIPMKMWGAGPDTFGISWIDSTATRVWPWPPTMQASGRLIDIGRFLPIKKRVNMCRRCWVITATTEKNSGWLRLTSSKMRGISGGLCLAKQEENDQNAEG